MSTRKLFCLLKRAADGARRRPWLHLLSISTLFSTFFCFALTLSAAGNLDLLLARWVGGAELTVYVKEGVPDSDIDRLTQALSKTAGVVRAEPISPLNARDIFAKEMGEFGDMVRSLPQSAFPVSVEVRLAPSVANDKSARAALVERIGTLSMVDEVDSYDDWFSKLSALSLLGRAAAWGLGLSALIVAVLVISAVIRTGIATRAREIEVLGFVGATQRYIRFPFLLEGAVESAAAMGLAVLCLEGLRGKAEAALGDVMPLIGMNGINGLGANVILLLVLGSMLAGVLGSRLSMKGVMQQG